MCHKCFAVFCPSASVQFFFSVFVRFIGMVCLVGLKVGIRMH